MYYTVDTPLWASPNERSFPMIYLDYAATAPVPRSVADAMYEVLAGQYGNPSSRR